MKIARLAKIVVHSFTAGRNHARSLAAWALIGNVRFPPVADIQSGRLNTRFSHLPNGLGGAGPSSKVSGLVAEGLLQSRRR